MSGGGGMTTVSTVTPHPEEPSDLEELEQFARTFKQRRIKLGFTQVGRDTTAPMCSWHLHRVSGARPLLNLFFSTRET